MKELFRSNDPVRMSRALGLLEDEGIPAFPMDQHMSVLEGSLGILPRRLMVADRDLWWRHQNRRSGRMSAVPA